jgi:oxalate decarboxylase/phosphoglucose isomerase-like protein (cupin superfamily)
VLYLDDEPRDLKPGIVVFIPGGVKHSLDNTSATEDFVLLTMWEKAEYNGVHHARVKAWGLRSRRSTRSSLRARRQSQQAQRVGVS